MDVFDACLAVEREGYKLWPTDKFPETDNYEYIEIGCILYYRERLTTCS